MCKESNTKKKKKKNNSSLSQYLDPVDPALECTDPTTLFALLSLSNSPDASLASLSCLLLLCISSASNGGPAALWKYAGSKYVCGSKWLYELIDLIDPFDDGTLRSWF
jgi:hypothetical protein